jgi:hypothetical protein
MADRKPGLARSRRPLREGQFTTFKKLKIGMLISRSRLDGPALARRDLIEGPLRGIARRGKERALSDRLRDRPIDIAERQALAVLDAAVEHAQHAPRLLSGVGRTSDLYLIPIGGGSHAETAFDMGEILVELPEDEARKPVIVEGNLHLRPLTGARLGRNAAARLLGERIVLHAHAAAFPSTRRPARLFGPAEVICTEQRSPIAASRRSTWTGCR